MNTTQNILQRVAIISPEIRCFTGTMSRGDDETEDSAFTPGGVRWVGPDIFRPVQRLRAAAARACRNRGTRFLTGWAVDAEKLDDLLADLNPIMGEAAEAIATLLAKIPEAREKWLETHPEVEAFLPLLPKNSDLATRAGVFLSVFKVENAAAVGSKARDGIVESIGELPMRVLEEIAQDVEASWGARGVATDKTVNVARRAAKKLGALTFLGGNLKNAADYVDHVLTSLPNGKLEGNDYVVFAALMESLKNPAFMASLAEDMTSIAVLRRLDEAKALAASAAETADADQGEEAPEAFAEPKGPLMPWEMPSAAAEEPAPPANETPENLTAEKVEEEEEGASPWQW